MAGLSALVEDQLSFMGGDYSFVTAGGGQSIGAIKVAGGPLNVGNCNSATFASVPYSGLGFILGGNGSDGNNVGGMVRFDASDPKNLSWTNETLANGSYGIDVPNYYYGGQMVYVPAGDEGILVVFGGANISAGIEPDWGWPYYSTFALISIYDIASHTWFLQKASGDIPAHKSSFCGVATTSPDGSAFHITIYGGYSLELTDAVETVSILTLPSFTWIDASSLSN
ncbi:hypothetical protein EJ03DRAFT_361225 [Teratosphaeria nubilosa]|uniref:Galactose oxidase n=1 Tax=Teratosphaeria nubilosa TaxID=161662 RepID=A0A6G1LBH7_9PEZI|nr:hypothetical protein EJ03DRAFT_361225 [Teratosphaeria nubilosa]